MERLSLVHATLMDPEARGPEPGTLVVEAGRMFGILPRGEIAAGSRVIDLAGRLLAPGFLDVHFHGRLPFSRPGSMRQALDLDAASMLRHGTTGFLATTVALDDAALPDCVKMLASCVNDAMLGIHLEGPWIALEVAGAQPRAGIRPYRAGEGRRLLDEAGGAIRMVTLAPEVEGADALLADLARAGVVASVGHTGAAAEQVEAAIGGGVVHATHLWNAMRGLHHRDPGVAGLVLADDRLTCDLICDGVHVHPALVRVAARAKGERLLLITDRIEPPEDGAGAGFGSGAVHDDGQALRLADGRLAGSTLHLDRAVRQAVAFGAMTLHEAVAAVTLRPARLLGLEAERGTFRLGARADLAVLDAAGQVHETWVAGARVFGAAG